MALANTSPVSVHGGALPSPKAGAHESVQRFFAHPRVRACEIGARRKKPPRAPASCAPDGAPDGPPPRACENALSCSRVEPACETSASR